MSLALLLLPLLPGLVDGVLKIIDAIARHPDTPEDAAQQLTDIAAQLDQVAVQVAAVQIRRPTA